MLQGIIYFDYSKSSFSFFYFSYLFFQKVALVNELLSSSFLS